MPSGSIGASGQWWRDLGAGHLLLAGGDYAMVEGDTHEEFRYLDGAFTRKREAGGREHTIALYVQDIWRPLPRLELTASVRVDYWCSEDGRRREEDSTSGAELVDESFSPRDEVFASPRLGVLFDVTSSLVVRASAYRGFRGRTTHAADRN